MTYLSLDELKALHVLHQQTSDPNLVLSADEFIGHRDESKPKPVVTADVARI